MLDPQSHLNRSDPNVLYFIIDIEALAGHVTRPDEAMAVIDEWFGMFDTVVRPQKDYFISDVAYRYPAVEDNDSFSEMQIENHWRARLLERISGADNVHALKLASAANRMGRNAFYSDKLWYMGKIPFSNQGSRAVAEMIEDTVNEMSRPAKKVLVLDLDNTLWGGVLGERGVEGIDLSDEHVGAVYRKVQEIVKAMMGQGILLALCSKNNPDDVQEVWDKHPGMVLKKDDFVSVKVNWRDKADNLREIAEELNLGMDSFVFIDDMAPERENIRQRLPEVTVPEFPGDVEACPRFMWDVYAKYFRKLRRTAEDAVKTRQYLENKQRDRSREGVSYEEFLASLELRAQRCEVNPQSLERIVQLLGKTNQFNLTARRYGRQDLLKMLEGHYELYAYRVWDRFGDYGLVALLIVDIRVPKIDTFLMSCRVMGKQLENFFINEVEEELLRRGYDELWAEYIPTRKNFPVAELYPGLGYETVESSAAGVSYRIRLRNRPRRSFFVNN